MFLWIEWLSLFLTSRRGETFEMKPIFIFFRPMIDSQRAANWALKPRMSLDSQTSQSHHLLKSWKCQDDVRPLKNSFTLSWLFVGVFMIYVPRNSPFSFVICDAKLHRRDKFLRILLITVSQASSYFCCMFCVCHLLTEPMSLSRQSKRTQKITNEINQLRNF